MVGFLLQDSKRQQLPILIDFRDGGVKVFRQS